MRFDAPYPNARFKNVLDDDGTHLGQFQVEVFNENKASIHTMILPEHRGMGFGRQMYDEAEKMLKEEGLTLVPSPYLSKDSLRIWKKRNVNALKYHEIRQGKEESGAVLSRIGWQFYRKDNLSWSNGR